jgi:hypothetical protein
VAPPVPNGTIEGQPARARLFEGHDRPILAAVAEREIRIFESPER